MGLVVWQSNRTGERRERHRRCRQPESATGCLAGHSVITTQVSEWLPYMQTVSKLQIHKKKISFFSNHLNQSSVKHWPLLLIKHAMSNRSTICNVYHCSSKVTRVRTYAYLFLWCWVLNLLFSAYYSNYSDNECYTYHWIEIADVYGTTNLLYLWWVCFGR